MIRCRLRRTVLINALKEASNKAEGPKLLSSRRTNLGSRRAVSYALDKVSRQLPVPRSKQHLKQTWDPLQGDAVLATLISEMLAACFRRENKIRLPDDAVWLGRVETF